MALPNSSFRGRHGAFPGDPRAERKKWGRDVALVEENSKAEPGAVRTDIFKFFDDVSAPLELKMLFVLSDSRGQALCCLLGQRRLVKCAL